MAPVYALELLTMIVSVPEAVQLSVVPHSTINFLGVNSTKFEKQGGGKQAGSDWAEDAISNFEVVQHNSKLQVTHQLSCR